ncbi:MAG: RAMP superfamily CRISPR-associated protein, partial [Tomitella sp.]|nr:RAMP superfamily CRISPR-associated protein [Tomitella sp.]
MDRWSGRLRLRITAETALLITDQERGRRRTRVIDGVPAIAPTSVKGMIRSEFEMVTNSRFGVFEDHDRRLGYRSAANRDAARLTPVRIAEDGRVDLLDGLDPRDDSLLKTCWVPRYNSPVAITGVPPHGMAVWAWVVLMEKVGKFRYHRAVSMSPERHPSPGWVDEQRHTRGLHRVLDAEPFELRGWYVDNGPNMP